MEIIIIQTHIRSTWQYHQYSGSGLLGNGEFVPIGGSTCRFSAPSRLERPPALEPAEPGLDSTGPPPTSGPWMEPADSRGAIGPLDRLLPSEPDIRSKGSIFSLGRSLPGSIVSLVVSSADPSPSSMPRASEMFPREDEAPLLDALESGEPGGRASMFSRWAPGAETDRTPGSSSPSPIWALTACGTVRPL